MSRPDMLSAMARTIIMPLAADNGALNQHKRPWILHVKARRNSNAACCNERNNARRSVSQQDMVLVKA
eukprot:CAMPEP_0206054766 /NCGR_PEP_ID=MMETSP1466-20131121/38801_1 /ASSEMBLY_ACC=CAM_ASM_001126 /TAXON_ID=44452 /ORGANISM="Pavlova gyrans, Strain CCMP608" /LENGTH=67 /DNA_ID=CAMNT_0053429987 /DNA_START=213 /DNA_END=413 /DNA_ORIENTATION=-